MIHNVEGHKDGKRAKAHLDRLFIPYEVEVEIVYTFKIADEHEPKLKQVFGR